MKIQNKYEEYAVNIATGLRDRDIRVQFPAGTGNFSLHHESRTFLVPTQPPIQWVPGGSFLGSKAAGA
jgi:hypothetical protein